MSILDWDTTAHFNALSDLAKNPEYHAAREELMEVFNGIFSTPAADPTTLSRDIFAVIKAHQSCVCAHALALSLLEGARESPKDVCAAVRATAAVFTAYPEATRMQIDARHADASPLFHREFQLTLTAVIGFGLGVIIVGEQHTGIAIKEGIVPSNLVLQMAALSGSVMDTEFIRYCKSALLMAHIALRLPEDTKDDRHEILVVAVCLQLATAGAQMVDRLFDLHDVVDALERLKKDEVVWHPGGVRLLETTIALAKTGFAESMSPAESWTILFPDEDEAPPTDPPGPRSSSNTHTNNSVFGRGTVGRALGSEKSFPDVANTPSMNPKREFHSFSSSASRNILTLPGTQYRLMTSSANSLTTHQALRAMGSTSGRHISMNVRRYSHILSGSSYFRALKFLRFVL